MYMLEIWKNMLDKEGYVCAMFVDLSKAFDTLHHALLIAKSGAYSFSQDALQYMRSYLTNRQQNVPVNSNFSTCGKHYYWSFSRLNVRSIVIQHLHQ